MVIVKHNCYTCKHRRNVPGSAHSSCQIEDLDERILTILAIEVARAGGNFKNIKLNGHGMLNGWAFWPLDFDPVWVEHCNFYESANN